MNFVRYLASRCIKLLRLREPKPDELAVWMPETLPILIDHPHAVQGARDYYIELLQTIGESPLDKTAVDGFEKSVYRLVITPSLNPTPKFIQITENSHCLTVVLKTVVLEIGELEKTIKEEIINIDRSDCLFHEHFRPFQENIDKLNFWAWPMVVRDMNRTVLDGVSYMIEVVDRDRYHWASGGSARKDEDFEKLCLLFLNLPVYDGSILESSVSYWKSSLTRKYYPAFKVQSAQEAEEEIEAELQALKANLKLESQDDI
jgi:hypothetical protein